MSRDSNGNATVNRQQAVTGQTVLAEQVNVPFADIQAMLNLVFWRDGLAPMTGPLNMNGFSITGLQDPSNSGDPVTLSYLNNTITQSGVPTGARMGFLRVVPPSGWVHGDGRTIGNSSSNATNRANQDTYNLYSLFWSSFPSLQIFSSSGSPTTRGPSFDADWNANKALALFDLRSEYDRGADAGRGIVSSSPGSTLADEIKGHTHTGVTDSGGLHNHPLTLYGGSGGAANTGGASTGPLGTDTTSVVGAGIHSHAFTTNSTGGSETRPRTVVTLHCIKL